MKIYALTKAYDHEGEALCGAFMTPEEAVTAISAIAERCDEWLVYEIAVGSTGKPIQVARIAPNSRPVFTIAKEG